MPGKPIWGIPPDLNIVEPNVYFAAEAASWGVPRDLFSRVWPIATGAGQRIAILDSGIRSSHKLIGAERVIASRSFVGGNLLDDNGHGTLCATTAGGTNQYGDFIGVAPGVEFLNAKVFTAQGSGPAIDEDVFKWCVDMGATIISYSGGGPSPYEGSRKGIQYASDNHVLFVCAAGNGGPNSIDYPGAFKLSCSVGASRGDGRLASFSSTNAEVDVAAPGEQVTAGNISGGYSVWNGTSAACPWTAGAAAIVNEARLKRGLPRFADQREWLDFVRVNQGPDIDPNPNQNYGVFSMLKVLDTLAKGETVWL